jgi:YqeY-like protein
MVWLPDMSTFPELVGDVRAIGWLESKYPFTRGSVPPEFLARLKQFEVHAGHSRKLLDLPPGLGDHICDFCPSPTGNVYDPETLGHGYIGIPSGNVLFIAPQLLPHYIEKHEYAPPVEFVTAVLESPLPGTDAYSLAVSPFLPKPLVKSAIKPRLLEKISSDLKQAMKAGETLRVSVLRLVLSEAANHHLQKGPDLPQTDDDIREVLRKMVALSIESVAEFSQGRRFDLAEKETREVEILREYLIQP